MIASFASSRLSTFFASRGSFSMFGQEKQKEALDESFGEAGVGAPPTSRRSQDKTLAMSIVN